MKSSSPLKQTVAFVPIDTLPLFVNALLANTVKKVHAPNVLNSISLHAQKMPIAFIVEFIIMTKTFKRFAPKPT